MAWRLRDPEFDLIDRDVLESVSVAPRRIQGREEQGQVGTLTCGFIEQFSDEGSRVAWNPEDLP